MSSIPHMLVTATATETETTSTKPATTTLMPTVATMTMKTTTATTTTKSSNATTCAMTIAAAAAAVAATTTTTTKTAIAPTRTTITSDPGILCFHHCNVKVFCFVLPHICPNCKTKLDTMGDDDDEEDGDDVGTEEGNGNDNDADNNKADNISNSIQHRNDGNGMHTLHHTTKVLLPFRLPYPFVRASQYPCAIVLRPTTGDFLNDYNNATDLHIALTTSTGSVVEFDRHGLRKHRAENMPEWWQCLLVGDVPEPWYDYWDDILWQLCKQPARWTIDAYQEDTHNCYTFVLAFLQALAYDKLSEAAHSKTTFCEKYIVPRTTTAGKYISLYRKLRDTGGGIYVHPYASKRQQQQHHQQQHAARSKVRGYMKPSALIVPTTTLTTASVIAKKSTKATNPAAASIMPRTPALCTIEE